MYVWNTRWLTLGLGSKFWKEKENDERPIFKEESLILRLKMRKYNIKNIKRQISSKAIQNVTWIKTQVNYNH